jgi:Rhs element Vgr protein
MTAPRAIAKQERPSFKLLSNGSEVERSINMVMLEVNTAVNKIAQARIVLADGDPATQTFAHSSGDVFVPGNELEIQLGYADLVETVFKGIIVKQKITSRGNAGMLELTCKHPAFRMANAEKFTVFEEMTDADVIQQKVQEYGLQPDAAQTTVTHENLVQYKTTDWDFLVNRAESNGHIVICEPDKLKTIAPEVNSTADLALQFGATLLDFEVELDGRNQEESLTAFGWSYDNQAANESESSLGDLATVGNLAAADLASALSNNPETSHYAAIAKQQELDALAAAEQTRRRLSKLRATVTVQGNTTCTPGSTVQLNGLGDRFNGNALVTGVLHTFKNGVWKTALQLGLNPISHLETYTPLPKSAYAIPRTQGLEIGIVTDLEDPTGSFRVRVQFPALGDQPSVWARMAQPDAGSERTVFFRPEVGDEVIVGFINDDPRAPIILGALHSSANASPVPQSNDNHQKGIVTRSDLRHLFDDEKKVITITTPAGNIIELSEDAQGIRIEDQNGNKIEMTPSGVTVESATALTLQAGTDLTIEAANITLKASAQFKAEGGACAELNSSGITKVNGSLVQIN